MIVEKREYFCEWDVGVPICEHVFFGAMSHLVSTDLSSRSDYVGLQHDYILNPNNTFVFLTFPPDPADFVVGLMFGDRKPKMVLLLFDDARRTLDELQSRDRPT